MGRIYQTLHAAAFLAALPCYALTRGGAAKYRQVLGPRFGRPPLDAVSGSLWIQAVSVGEVGVAEILAGEIRRQRPHLPLLVTTTTVTGQARAQAAFPDDSVGYFPFDFSRVARRAVQEVQPSAFVMIETEIWPGIIEEMSRAGVPIVLANARISDRSFPRYRFIKPLLKPTLDRIDRVLAAGPLDAERLAALGLPSDRIIVTGSVKFDRELPADTLSWDADRSRLFGSRPILVAGSTAEGEEESVLDAFRFASRDGEKAALILAPRHPNRFDEVARLTEKTGLRVSRRSSFTPEGRARDESGEIDVLLLDTIGELGRAYRGAAGAFIGGSLVPVGGHNPIEASLFGVPVAVGPHVSNFRDIVDSLSQGRGIVVVEGAARLSVLWKKWIDEPAAASMIGEAGRCVVDASRGAAARTAAVIAQFLPENS